AKAPEPAPIEAPVAVAAASASRPPKAAPSPAVDEEAGDSDGLLAPPPTPKAASQVKRVVTAKKPRPAAPRGKDLTPLQKQWRETNTLFNRLKAQHSCMSLGIWCNRYDDIKEEVEAAGDVNDTETLRKVKLMHKDLTAKQKVLE
ncbi:serine/threonine protein kinase, partial [Pyxidicoccus sp. 3LG]